MNRIFTFFCLSCLLLLPSCVSRGQADAKLARGCAAGVELFLADGFVIKEIKNKTYSNDPKLGESYRVVVLEAIESDSWLDVEKEYRCVFSEGFGLLNGTHSATIHQIKVNDQTYGKEGDKILGTFEDHLRLTEVVEQGMNTPVR
jgi:hypothetical protein